MNVAELLDLTVWKRFLLFALLVFPALNRASALVVDDAMTLSVRVPHQLYVFTPEAGGYLRKDNAEWLIPLEACDPATLTIHTTNLKYAPYAVRIVTGHRQPSWEMSTDRRLDEIHLLAMSKDDAVRMRRALISEIDATQRFLEKRQGNRPGFLKEKARKK